MKQIHVEASTFCNARCPLCPRSLYGYKVDGVHKELHLDPKVFEKVLEDYPEREYVYFNGNLGDPMMHPSILELVKLNKCESMITTNGSIGLQSTWIELAEHKVEVVFSIDGLEDTNHLYRQDVEWNKIMDRAKWFIGAGGNAVWKFIVFRHNMHQVNEAKQLSETLGFKEFRQINHGSNYGPALDREGNITHWILPHNEKREPTPYDVKQGIKRYRIDHRNFISEERVYDIKCNHEIYNEVYIDARGRVSPCCFQAVDLPKVPFVNLESFPSLKETWVTKKCNPVCAMNCGN